jgi:hypothetical protein
MAAPALLDPKRTDYNHYLPAGRNQFLLGGERDITSTGGKNLTEPVS